MTLPLRHDRYDVVIAGARCAGASTAMLLARAGLGVLVVDPLPRGRDTLSTHALMRGGVVQLRRWGLLDRVITAGTPAVRMTTFDYGDEVIPVAIAPKHGVDALYAPKRTVLDPILSDAAAEAGAEVVRGARIAALDRDGTGRVRGAWVAGREGAVRVASGLVVGADGLSSGVAGMTGARLVRSAPQATGTVFGYFPGFPDDEYRWSFRAALGTGFIPTDDGEAVVFAAIPPALVRRAGRQGIADLFVRSLAMVDPEVAERVAPLVPGIRLRAFAGRPGHLRRAHGPGWALVGDAGFFRDPLTAHGITDAFRDAELLARAVLAGDERALRGYGEARDSVAMELLDVTSEIASLTWTLDEVRELHRRLNRAMNAGLDLILALDGSSTVAGTGVGASARVEAVPGLVHREDVAGVPRVFLELPA